MSKVIPWEERRMHTLDVEGWEPAAPTEADRKRFALSEFMHHNKGTSDQPLSGVFTYRLAGLRYAHDGYVADLGGVGKTALEARNDYFRLRAKFPERFIEVS